MTIREQIIQEALSWNGTKWHHRSCLKGIGTDCVCLLAGVAKAVGLLAQEWQPPRYSPDHMLHSNEECLLGVLATLGCLPIPLGAQRSGDALIFQYGRVSSHAAILVADTPPYIVHAARDVGRVVHQRLSGPLLARLRQCFAFPGVA